MDERTQLRTQGMLQSTNPTAQGRTWFTLDVYDDPVAAQQLLALKRPPLHRVGPVPESEMSEWLIGLRRVEPLFGQPGGGTEACFFGPIVVFGVRDLAPGLSKWEPI